MAETIKIGGELESMATGKVVAAASAIKDKTKNKYQSEINAETDATLATHTSQIQGFNNQNYVTVVATSLTTDVTDVLPAEGSIDTVYRVGNWDGTQYDVTCYSEYSWSNNVYQHISTKTQIGEVFDISAYHATGGTLATYTDLSAALDSNNGGGVPQSLQEGGMQVRFVRSSDNKYVQFRYMLDDATNVSDFTNPDNWSYCGNSVLVEDDNYIILLKDKNGLILFSIKKDASVDWGKGVPTPVKKYITEYVGDIHEYDNIVDFLGNLIYGDKTIQQLLSEKVDKEMGKSLISADVADNTVFKESVKYVELKVDASGNVLEAITQDNIKEFNFSGIKFKGQILANVESNDWIKTEKDLYGNIIFGFKKNGTVYLSKVDILRANSVETDNILFRGKTIYDAFKEWLITPSVWAPKKIYAMQGVKMQLFTCGLVRAMSPENFHLDINKISGTAKGYNLDRVFEYTPAAGDAAFTYNFGCRNDFRDRMASPNNTEITPIAAKSSPSSNKNILLIGDSFTYGGYYPAELKRLLTGVSTTDYSDPNNTHGDDGLTNLTFIGTRRTDVVPCEGYGGWAYSDFCAATHGTTPNPFWDSTDNDINFTSYCSRNGYSGIDIAIIVLGRNMGYQYNTGAYAKKVWDKLIEHNSNIKILVLTHCFPAPYGAGILDGMTANLTWWGRSEDIQKLAAYYEELAATPAYSSNVLFVEANCLIDNHNNMDWQEVNANDRRSDVKVRQATDGVHPSKYGYWQYADAIRPAFHYWCL